MDHRILHTSEWALSERKETAAGGRKGMDKGKNTWIQYVAKPNGKQRERECTLKVKRRVGLSDKVIIQTSGRF